MSEFVDTMFWVSSFILFQIVPWAVMIITAVGVWKILDAAGDTIAKFASWGKPRRK